MQEKNKSIEKAPLIPVIIDNSDFIICKFDDLPKSLDRIKRKNHTWKILKREKKKQGKIYINDKTKTPSEKVLYSRDKKLVILKPEKIEKNELVFFLNKHCKCTFNHVYKWILPEKMRRGIKSMEIGHNYFGNNNITNIPEILFRNEPTGDVMLPFPEILIPPFSTIFIVIVYNENPPDSPEIILKTDIIGKIENFYCEIPIIDFSYINISVNSNENNLIINQCEKIHGIFKKFTVIFEDSLGNFQPINFISLYWKIEPGLIIYKNIEKFSNQKFNENNIYNLKLKNYMSFKYHPYTPFEFRITLPENNVSGILHLIAYTKNILCFRDGCIGKMYGY